MFFLTIPHLIDALISAEYLPKLSEKEREFWSVTYQAMPVLRSAHEKLIIGSDDLSCWDSSTLNLKREGKE